MINEVVLLFEERRLCGYNAVDAYVVRLSGDRRQDLEVIRETDKRRRGRRLLEEPVVEPFPPAQTVALCVKRDARDNNQINQG